MVDITVSVQPDHIQKLIKPTQPVAAIIELIWNSIDADANEVRVVFERNDLDGIESVKIIDDGTGMTGVARLFENLGGSWKSRETRTKKNRPLHGKKGEGRFRAFALGENVEWRTVYEDPISRERSYSIISAKGSSPEKFTIMEHGKTSLEPGTTLVMTGASRTLSALSAPGAVDRITREFARTLRRYPSISISYDSQSIDASSVISDSTTAELEVDPVGEFGKPVLEIIEWSRPLQRELVLCDANGFSLSELKPGVQAPQFSFCAYVSWSGFSSSDIELAELGHEKYSPIIEEARNYIRNHFREKAKKRDAEVIKTWKDENVYPFKGEAKSKIEKTKRQLFDAVAIQALPGISPDPKSKKLSLRLIREALEHSPSSLKTVLSEVLDLNEQQLGALAAMLDRTSLGTFISAAQVVSDRLDFLRSLEILLFDEVIRKDLLERSQLHRILAAEPWIFGEQFALAVDDKGIKEVLRRHLGMLGRESLNIADVQLEDRKTAVVDLMLSKTIQDTEKQHHLIVELKRPSVKIGYKEKQQIESYAMAVAGDSRFRDSGTKWDFVLLANSVTDDIRRLSNKKNHPPGWLHEDEELNLRIWIRHWGGVIEDRRRELHFYRDKLEIDPSREESLSYLRGRYAKFLPQSVQEEAS